MKKAISWFLLVGLVIFTANAVHADCVKGKALYELAMNESAPELRLELLEKSTAECRDFASYYALGRGYAEAQRFKEAEQVLRDAVNMTADNKCQAKALAGLGLVLESMGKDYEAGAALRQSYKVYPSPRVLNCLKAIDQRTSQRIMHADEIKRSLKFRGFSVESKPSLDLRTIRFDYDSADLNTEGRAQVDELGKALSSPDFKGRGFILIGHTDKRGSDAYNMDLSKRRAAAVRDYLVRFFSLDASRLASEGRGKRELLYPGGAEQDHALNRRVEVKLK